MSDKDNDPRPVPFKYKYCRLCAWELKQGVLIFGEEGKRLQIPEKIRKTLNILIFEEDGLPKKICTDCCSSLEDYATYKDTVLDAQEKLTTISRFYPPPSYQSQETGHPHPSSTVTSSSSSSVNVNIDRKPCLKSLLPNVVDANSSALTCQECGKKFKIRSEFESHMGSAHPVHSESQGHHSNIRVKILPNEPSSAAGNGQQDDQNNIAQPRPSSPPESVIHSPYENEPETDPEYTVIDMERGRDSKVGILRIPEPEQQSVTTVKSQPVFTATNENEGGPTSKEISTSTSYECSYCGKILSSNTGLHNHMMVHKGRRFHCKICGVNYAQKRSLQLHMKTYHPDSTDSITSAPPEDESAKIRICCPECPATFARQSNFNIHMKGHTERREFECTFCNKSYKTDKCLRKHLKCHTAVDSFPCLTCGKAFYRRARLIEHENTHAEKRPIGCNFCVKTFNNQPNYAKHIKRKHSDQIKDGKMPHPVKLTEDPLPPVPDRKSNHRQTHNQPLETTTSQTQGQALTNYSNSTHNTQMETIQLYAADPTPTPAPLSLATEHAPSPHWVDLTGKQQQQQQSSQIQQNSSITTTLPQHSNPHQVQQTHHLQTQHSHSQMNDQQHQQHAHNSHHYQLSQHSLNHSSGQIQSQHQQTPSNHPSSSSTISNIQQSQSHNNYLHQQQSYPHPHLNNQQQSSSLGPSSSQQSQSQSIVSSGSGSHQHHSHLQPMMTPMVQQHYGHHVVQQLQPLPLGSQSNSHYSHNNHNQLSSLDMVERAMILSAFGQENQYQNPGQEQNHPMELSYKQFDTAFQDMPMELTKVLQSQSGPLELCVRDEFNQQVDLTPKESNFNERMNVMDFRQQPMDLISRNEVCTNSGLTNSDNNNLVDLSLRSSFPDQADSSFFRDLIDLSSRSDYHGELNLSAKGHLNF